MSSGWLKHPQTDNKRCCFWEVDEECLVDDTTATADGEAATAAMATA
jgi:hypothetical protein